MYGKKSGNECYGACPELLLAELLVLINAEQQVERGRVVEIMDDARQADVAKMAIALKPRDGR